jgi:peptide/nickel transport system substrate-binding protein
MWPRRDRRRYVWPAALILALVVAAPILSAGGLVLLVEPPAAPDTYVEAVAGEPPLLNPVLAPYTLAGQDALPLLFSGLMRADAAGNVEPDLAESLAADEDGRTYLARLRAGLVWDDGEPLTAEDVAFTIRMVQAPDHQGSQELAELWRGVDVEVVDARTVRFVLPTPLASFPDHLTLGLLPRHVLADTPASALPLHAYNRQPVGIGPYRVVSFEPGRLVLERSLTYYGTPARLGRIELRPYADRAAALRALLDGGVDGMAGLRPDEVQQVNGHPRIALYAFPERSKVAQLLMNLDAPALKDVAVRRAIAEAVDRQSIIAGALGGQAESAYGPIPVQSWAFARPGALPTPEQISPARLLEEAGWTVGVRGIRQRDGAPLRLELATADTPDRIAVARVLAEQLRAVGVEMVVRAVPLDELFDDFLEPRRFETVLFGEWVIGGDPDVYPRWHSSQIGRAGGNYSGFSDPDVDRWLETGRQASDRDARRNAYLHFQARWAQEQPSVVLYHPVSAFAVARDVVGVTADPVPDASWRLRSAVQWRRATEPSAWHEARASLLARASWLIP